ncbi:MAG: hypothetical protein SGPRY_012084, partial [Prymnesium sp.]
MSHLVLDETLELAELHDMLSDARDSAVPVGVYVKYLSSEQNKIKAEAVRREREERQARRAEMARERQEHAQAVRDSLRERNQKGRQALVAHKQHRAREVRHLEFQWDEVRKKQDEQQRLAMATQVVASRGGDERLSALEAAAAERLRLESAAEKKERKKLLAQALSLERERSVLENKKRVCELREKVTSEVSRAIMTREERNQALGVQTREEAARNGQIREDIEQERLAAAARKKEAALESRRNAARMKEQLVARRTQDLRGLVSSQDEMAEKEFAEANAEYARRLLAVKARTDDELMDEQAGLVRAKLKRSTQLQREAEQKKRHEENDAMRKRLHEIKTAIVQSNTRTAADNARQMTMLAKARREAEETALRKRNAAMRKHLNWKVSLDANGSVEVPDRPREQMAHESRQTTWTITRVMKESSEEWRRLDRVRGLGEEEALDRSARNEQVGLAKQGDDPMKALIQTFFSSIKKAIAGSNDDTMKGTKNQ